MMTKRDSSIFKHISPLYIRNAGLVLLTLSLSLLSLEGQFFFWKGMFDARTAVIASSVFEILRLASLYTLIRWTGKRKAVSVALYVTIAIFCSAFALTSRHAEILEVQARIDAQRSLEIQSRIDTLKTAYAVQIKGRIDKLDQDIYYIESMIAKNPGSQSLVKRREQLKEMRSDLVKERDEFLSAIPENPELWIQKNAAMLGLKIDPIRTEESEFKSLERAVMSTWGMESEVARMFVAIVFVVAIEIAIILLAVMVEVRGPRDIPVTKNDSVVSYLTKRFAKSDIKMFVEKCRDKYDQSGDLPMASELTKKLRPIRYEIMQNGFDGTDLKALFDHYRK